MSESNGERRHRYHCALKGTTWNSMADAVMAVADAEQRGLRENLQSAEAEIREQDAELAHLGSELKDNDRYIQRLDVGYDLLRSELALVGQRLVLADEMQKERACLTPGYTEGPCHCAHCDPGALERDNVRLRAELRDTKTRAVNDLSRAAADALSAETQAAEHYTTLQRVRAWTETTEYGAAAAAVRAALDGADE